MSSIFPKNSLKVCPYFWRSFADKQTNKYQHYRKHNPIVRGNNIRNSAVLVNGIHTRLHLWHSRSHLPLYKHHTILLPISTARRQLLLHITRSKSLAPVEHRATKTWGPHPRNMTLRGRKPSEYCCKNKNK